MFTAAEKKLVVEAFGRNPSPIKVRHDFLNQYGIAKGRPMAKAWHCRKPKHSRVVVTQVFAIWRVDTPSHSVVLFFSDIQTHRDTTQYMLVVWVLFHKIKERERFTVGLIGFRAT